MNVVAINGSPRRESYTGRLLAQVCDRLEKHGIQTEVVQIGGSPVRGCLACGKCFDNQDQQCVIKSDSINAVIEKMMLADGILLGSPSCFFDVSTEMKALLDRAGYVTLANGSALAGKVGAEASVVRSGGAQQCVSSMQHFFSSSQMPIATSSYWNRGDRESFSAAEQDIESMQLMDNLGENMAWLMKSIEAGKGTVPPPEIDRSKPAHFIRLEATS